jgi:hypothetical protein
MIGDVNGDSSVSATDVTALYRETNGLTAWSLDVLDDVANPEYNKAYVLAGDLHADGVIDSADADTLQDVTLAVAEIDQTNGAVIYY